MFYMGEETKNLQGNRLKIYKPTGMIWWAHMTIAGIRFVNLQSQGGLSTHFFCLRACLLCSTYVRIYFENYELSVLCLHQCPLEKFLQLAHPVNKIDSECRNKCWCELPEYISRHLLTSSQELPVIPFALCFLWSASHNVKERVTCPFAISLIWSRYFLSYHINAMRSVRNLLSRYLPLSLFPSFFRPLAVPRSPSTPPRAAFHLLWAALCIKAGIWVMYKSIFCTCPTLQFRQAWSVQDLLVRLPWGIPGVWSHLPGYKKASSLWGRETGRVIESQKERVRGTDRISTLFYNLYFTMYIIGFILCDVFICNLFFWKTKALFTPSHFMHLWQPSNIQNA